MANFCHLGFSYSLLFFQIQKRFLPFKFLFIILVFGLFGSRTILTASFFYAVLTHLVRQNHKLKFNLTTVLAYGKSPGNSSKRFLGWSRRGRQNVV